MSFDVNKQSKKLIRDWLDTTKLNVGTKPIYSYSLKRLFQNWLTSTRQERDLSSLKLFTSELKKVFPFKKSTEGTQLFISKESLTQLGVNHEKFR